MLAYHFFIATVATATLPVRPRRKLEPILRRLNFLPTVPHEPPLSPRPSRAVRRPPPPLRQPPPLPPRAPLLLEDGGGAGYYLSRHDRNRVAHTENGNATSTPPPPPPQPPLSATEIDAVRAEPGHTLLGRKLSLNCLFAGRNNNNFDPLSSSRELIRQFDQGSREGLCQFFTGFSNFTIVMHPGI